MVDSGLQLPWDGHIPLYDLYHVYTYIHVVCEWNEIWNSRKIHLHKTLSGHCASDLDQEDCDLVGKGSVAVSATHATRRLNDSPPGRAKTSRPSPIHCGYD
jgi:hypothetical protein